MPKISPLGITLSVLFAASAATTSVCGYKAVKESYATQAFSEASIKKHGGVSEMDVLLRLQQPEYVMTAEDKEIVMDGRQLHDMWRHEKTMHGVAIAGLFGTIASLAAIGYRKATLGGNIIVEDAQKSRALGYTTKAL